MVLKHKGRPTVRTMEVELPKRKELWIVGCIVVIVLGIFSIYDLAISQAVYNPKSIFGNVLQTIGELPSSITAVCSAMVFLRFSNRLVGGKRYITYALCLFLILTASAMGCMLSLKYAGYESWVLVLLLMLVMIAVCYVFVRCIPEDKAILAKQIGLMGILLFFLSLLTFNGIKMSWGRMRYEFMSTPSIEFTHWFMRQGFTTDNMYMSFPSGHAAQSSFILMLTLLPYIFIKLHVYARLLKSIAYLWIIMVCISRVIMGMHFASDVTIGFTITFVFFHLLRYYCVDKHLIKRYQLF